MRAIGWFVLGAAATLIALEGILRLLPTSTSTDTGYHVDPMIITYPPGHQFFLSSGWNLRHAHRHRANNFGFVADRDFTPNPQAVALIGDSFVEASTLDPQDRLGAQLEGALDGRPVYTLGGPGSSLLDYAERIRFSAEHFRIVDFILLIERGDIRQTLCGSGNIHGPCLDPKTLEPRVEKRPAPGALKRIARHSALAQYLFSQLMIDPVALWSRTRALFAAPAPAPVPNAAGFPLDAVDRIGAEFFRRLQPFRQGRLVMIFDCDRAALARGKPASDPVRDRFMAIARDAGAQVIDTEPMFRKHLATTGLRLEVAPNDSHWNREANRIVGAATASVLP